MHARLQRTKEATSLFGNSRFLRLWVAQFSGIMVFYALNLAGPALVEEQTQSSAHIGLVILAVILPAFLASLVGGAVVDRWGRGQVLLVGQASRVVLALAFWAGTRWLPGGLAVVTVLVVNAAGAIATQFVVPAELALLPDLVDGERLLSANALVQLGHLTSQGIGIVVLSPMVIKLAGAPAMGLVGAALCLVAVFLVAGLPKDVSPSKKAGQFAAALADFGVDLQQGWRTIVKDRVLSLVALQLTLAGMVLMVLLSLVPGLATRRLGVGVEDAPILLLPGGLGFILGSVVLGRIGGRASRISWIVLGLAGLGLSLSAVALLSGGTGQDVVQGIDLVVLAPTLLFISVLGLALAFIIVPSRTVLQERPPVAMRGRVIAVQLALGNGVAVLPLALGGTLADHLGIQPVMGLLGLVALGAGAIGLHHITR